MATDAKKLYVVMTPIEATRVSESRKVSADSFEFKITNKFSAAGSVEDAMTRALLAKTEAFFSNTPEFLTG